MPINDKLTKVRHAPKHYASLLFIILCCMITLHPARAEKSDVVVAPPQQEAEQDFEARGLDLAALSLNAETLKPVEGSVFDHFYLHPKANLMAYQRIAVMWPSLSQDFGYDISFGKRPYKLNDAAVERVKDLYHQQFIKYIERKTVFNALMLGPDQKDYKPGTGTLVLRGRIMDVRIPASRQAIEQSRSRSFAPSAIAMKLVLTLETPEGEIIAIADDKRGYDSVSPHFKLVSSPQIYHDAGRHFAIWARSFSQVLDAASRTH